MTNKNDFNYFINRYRNLDALRGIAAIAVLLGHAQGFNIINTHWINHTYLAVDFFFILSGFVISSAYKSKIINKNLTIKNFLTIRIFRFSPMLFLSGTLTLIISAILFFKGKILILDVFLNYLSNTSLIPLSGITDELNKTQIIDHYLFHINPPLWSLFYEIIVNLIWAALLIKQKKHNKIYFIIIITFLTLLAFRMKSLDVGPTANLEGIIFGFARAMLGIFIGALLYNKEKLLSRHFKKIPSHIGYFALVFILFTPLPKNYFFELTLLTLAFPLIILSCSQPSQKKYNKLDSLKKWLGDISFPLYIIHYPILLVISNFYENEFTGLILMILCIPLSSYVAKLIDYPLRDKLKKWS